MTDAFDNLGIYDLNRVLHLGHLLVVDSASERPLPSAIFVGVAVVSLPRLTFPPIFTAVLVMLWRQLHVTLNGCRHKLQGYHRT